MAANTNSASLEVWRVVPSYPRLEASSFGRVRRTETTALMPNGATRVYKPIGTFGAVRRSRKGAVHAYRGVHYRDTGNIKVHRAVCEAFHGPAPFVGAVVIHKNENALDNRPENLKWGTQKENLNAPGFRQYCRDVIAEKLGKTHQ